MQFTAEELAIINVSINMDAEGRQRSFTVDELPEVTALSTILKGCTEEKETDKGPVKVFKDSEVKFTAAQSVLITGFVKGLKWGVGDGAVVLSLLEKIK